MIYLFIWTQISREAAFFFEHGLIFFWTQIGREAAFFFERGLIFFWTNLAAKRPEFFFEFFFERFFRREAASFFLNMDQILKKNTEPEYIPNSANHLEMLDCSDS